MSKWILADWLAIMGENLVLNMDKVIPLRFSMHPSAYD